MKHLGSFIQDSIWFGDVEKGEKGSRKKIISQVLFSRLTLDIENFEMYNEISKRGWSTTLKIMFFKFIFHPIFSSVKLSFMFSLLTEYRKVFSWVFSFPFTH